MEHRLPPATIITSSPLMTTTKTPHLLVSDSETPEQRSEGQDQPECRHDGIEDTERRQWLYKKAHAQQPSAGSLTSSNSSSSSGSSSDGDDSDGMTPEQDQHLALSRSSLISQWCEASSAMSEKAAVNVVTELVEERGDDSLSKYQPQTHYVMNKARDLCARIRHQAKVKQREERKRILLERQKARDLARQAAESAREDEAREAALRLHAQKEVTKAARQEQELTGKQLHEDMAECSHASDQHHGHRTLSVWGKHAHASTRDQQRLQAVGSQVDMFYATPFAAREALHQRQASMQQTKAFQQEERDKEGRLIQAAKMERLREGVLLWDRWVVQRAIFIWYVKAQHMGKLQQQHQHQHQQKKKQQQGRDETKARVAAAAAATFALSFSSFAGWAVDAGKWLKWQVDRACAPPRRPQSPSHYLDEC